MHIVKYYTGACTLLVLTNLLFVLIMFFPHIFKQMIILRQFSLLLLLLLLLSIFQLLNKQYVKKIEYVFVFIAPS